MRLHQIQLTVRESSWAAVCLTMPQDEPKVDEMGQKQIQAGKSNKYCGLTSSAAHESEQKAFTVTGAGAPLRPIRLNAH